MGVTTTSSIQEPKLRCSCGRSVTVALLDANGRPVGLCCATGEIERELRRILPKGAVAAHASEVRDVPQDALGRFGPYGVHPSLNPDASVLRKNPRPPAVEEVIEAAPENDEAELYVSKFPKPESAEDTPGQMGPGIEPPAYGDPLGFVRRIRPTRSG